MSQGWRPVENFDDWMRNIERRIAHEERRPGTPTAQSLLGPGFGPRAVQLLDWNSQTARFNGFWVADEQTLNGPITVSVYLGLTISSVEGHVLQVAFQHPDDLTTATGIFVRRAHQHNVGGVSFSDWEVIAPPVPRGAVVFLPSADPLPLGWAEAPTVTAPAGLRAISRV